jgi:hypothetical protein
VVLENKAARVPCCCCCCCCCCCWDSYCSLIVCGLAFSSSFGALALCDVVDLVYVHHLLRSHCCVCGSPQITRIREVLSSTVVCVLMGVRNLHGLEGDGVAIMAFSQASACLCMCICVCVEGAAFAQVACVGALSRAAFCKVPNKYRLRCRVTAVWPENVKDFTRVLAPSQEAGSGEVVSAPSQPLHQYFFTLCLDDGTGSLVAIVTGEHGVRVVWILRMQKQPARGLG